MPARTDGPGPSGADGTDGPCDADSAEQITSLEGIPALSLDAISSVA